MSGVAAKTGAIPRGLSPKGRGPKDTWKSDTQLSKAAAIREKFEENETVFARSGEERAFNT